MLTILRTFWSAVIEERSLRAGADALSFAYLGDFMFAGRIVVEPHPVVTALLRRSR